MLGQEIEFKYKANVTVNKFIEVCKKKTGKDYLFVTGTDEFYENPGDATSFFRHRVGSDLEQLTFKRKLFPNNNVVRTEYNIEIKKGSHNPVPALLNELGYRYNFSLRKSAFIFVTENYIVVYYICYDEDRKEIGRFIEIELAENLPWSKEEHALASLRELEKRFRVLKIGPTKRIKKSLWEMFKQ